MHETYITHQPLISRQNKVIGNRLTLHVQAGDPGAMAVATSALREVEEYWPTGQQAYFLNFNGAPLAPALFDWMVPENATLEATAGSLLGDAKEALLTAIHDNGAALCINVDAQIGQALASGFKPRFVGLDARTFPVAQIQTLAVKLKPAGIPIAQNVDSQPDFKTCSDAGLHAASGWFCKHAVAPKSKSLAPNQAHIVRLLNLVRNNADVAQIETALKQDVALSYKLLRYINSAGFGLSCEIQSFRHAVTMLGYDKLHKWLSLLLVTASKDAMAPALMHTALARARMMELLGQGLVNKGETDNLFITGAFSLLDHLLGVDMEKALAEMHLPEAISEALLSRTGLYAPFYELVLACEGNDCAKLGELAASLGIDALRVNAALLQALAFAVTMDA